MGKIHTHSNLTTHLETHTHTHTHLTCIYTVSYTLLLTSHSLSCFQVTEGVAAETVLSERRDSHHLPCHSEYHTHTHTHTHTHFTTGYRNPNWVVSGCDTSPLPQPLAGWLSGNHNACCHGVKRGNDESA